MSIMKKKIKLTNLEETVCRMSNGHSLEENDKLSTKTDDPKILSKLQELEKEIIIRAISKGFGHLVNRKN